MILIVSRIPGETLPKMLEIGGAGDSLSLPLRLVQRRQQHSCEDCDDRNHDEQLYQCEIFLVMLS